MKILVINWQCIKNPLGGGAEVHLHEIFKRIAAKGHEVTLFCSRYPNSEEHENIDGINVIRKGERNFFNFLVPMFYNQYFKNINYDIIIDDINKVPFYTPLYVKKPLLAVSHHFFGKSIIKEAGRVVGSYILLAEKMVDYIYKNTRFAVVSQSTLDEFKERHFNISNFTIVPNAIEPANFPMKIGKKAEKPTIAYFGRLKKYKSVDHLFFAFKNVLNIVPDAQLCIMGRGDFQPYLEKLAGELNISDKVVFHGYVTEEEKINLLSLAHCAVNTSMKEGWGITNIEANACGTPVISANSPGLRDSVKNGISGLLYKYADINELSDNIIKILTNQNLLNSLSEGAVEWAGSFSWDKSSDIMIQTCLDTIKAYEYNKK